MGSIGTNWVVCFEFLGQLLELLRLDVVHDGVCLCENQNVPVGDCKGIRTRRFLVILKVYFIRLKMVSTARQMERVDVIRLRANENR